MALGEREIIQRARAGEMNQLREEHGLTEPEIRRIMYPNSEDPIFPYVGSPHAQAEMIVAEREEGAETDAIPPGSEDTGSTAMEGAGVERPAPGQ